MATLLELDLGTVRVPEVEPVRDGLEGIARRLTERVREDPGT